MARAITWVMQKTGKRRGTGAESLTLRSGDSVAQLWSLPLPRLPLLCCCGGGSCFTLRTANAEQRTPLRPGFNLSKDERAFYFGFFSFTAVISACRCKKYPGFSSKK